MPTAIDVHIGKAIEQRVIEQAVDRPSDPTRQIGAGRLGQAKLPLHIGVGIDTRDIRALLLEWRCPPCLHANARGPQRIAGDPGLIAGCHYPAIGRDRFDIELRYLKPDIRRDDRGLISARDNCALATATRAPRLPPSSIGIAKPTVVSALRTPDTARSR